MSQRALIVDDEADIRALLDITLARMGLEVVAAENLAQAYQALDDGPLDLCLTDMRLPDGRGLDLVKQIQAEQRDIPVAVITAYGNTEDAVESLKSGAFDFVTKPVDLDVLRGLVNTALKAGQPDAPPNEKGPQLTGSSDAMNRLREMIAKLARNQAPVMIRGESGTGKELVARSIHQQGPRAARPFVPVNCGAIPSELMESEFFGHLKGSFTGASSDKQGLFQAADHGTLFLDEIAELPLPMQVKLLRAIQERKIRPVGGHAEVAVDVRIISATHQDLQQAVQDGRFRQDLYYRLNVIELQVPALRERPEDIPALCEALLGRIGARHGTGSLQITAEACDALKPYRFPGNVRELENILERAAALCDSDCIRPENLQLPEPQQANIDDHDNASAPAGNIDDSLAAAERERILAALEKTRFNKTKAARLLGISFRSLRYRLKKLEID